MKRKTMVLGAAILLVGIAEGASLDKARMLHLHGLTIDAKKELIEVIFSKEKATHKAEAYYMLGTLAFEQNDISAALETWTQLIGDFPNSDQAKLVKDRIKLLSESIGEASRNPLENIVAQSYLRNAEFWSEGKSKRFVITPPSGLLKMEVAISWYDRVIQEFPQTTASRIAYEGKMLILIGWVGWENIGSSDDVAVAQTNFEHYMPQLVETFSVFERDYPEASTLQAFRFQIVQQYYHTAMLTKALGWYSLGLDKTDHYRNQAREWLNLVIEKAGEQYTFYRDIAECYLRYLRD